MVHRIAPLFFVFLFQNLAFAADHYANFAELSAKEAAKRDYQITAIHQKSPIAVFAIHGGLIEQGTSAFARKLAGSDKSLYLFEGVKSANNRILHLTSTQFDEPQAVALAKEPSHCLSLHGYKDEEQAGMCIGGKDEVLAKKIATALKAAKLPIEVTYPCKQFPAIEANNIVNRCKNAGVQLELSSQLRKLFEKQPEVETKVVTLIRGFFLDLD